MWPEGPLFHTQSVWLPCAVPIFIYKDRSCNMWTISQNCMSKYAVAFRKNRTVWTGLEINFVILTFLYCSKFLTNYYRSLTWICIHFEDILLRRDFASQMKLTSLTFPDSFLRRLLNSLIIVVYGKLKCQGWGARPYAGFKFTESLRKV